MRGVRFGTSRGDFVRLFEGDSVAGLGEGELLARFTTRRDEAAFEALVTRLGPMVLGVCRRMLSDPHDVDDAFQATFLVLVKKAESIRDRDLVAPWLHGVASKVARRARADSARRKAREKVAMVAEAVEDGAGVESGWLELRALIDEEIERLPEAHRRAVVLCDVEGLSREEAALRLGWSLNMVRGRLERARGRLRGRLARRGVAPSGAWMALKFAPPVPSPSLLSTTIRASLAFSSGRMATGLASASAVALSRGVLRMMMLSKLKVGLALLVSAGFVAGGSGMLAAQGPGDKPGAEAAKVAVPSAPPTRPVQDPQGDAQPLQPMTVAGLMKARVEAASRLYNLQNKFYKNARTTIDRVLEASHVLMEAERDAADSKRGRIQALRDHTTRLHEVMVVAKAMVEAGRATGADVAETDQMLLNAELSLARELEAPEAKPAGVNAKASSKPSASTRASLDQERVAIARRLYDEAKRLYPSEISLEDMLEAAINLAKAEEGAAGTKAERVAAIRTQVDRLKRIVASKEEMVKVNEAKRSDVDRLRLRLLDAESHLLDVSGTPDGAGDAVASAPGGPIPASGPGASKGAEDRTRSPLATRIEAFNEESLNTPAGRGQPPLTLDEFVAAIRFFEPPKDAPVDAALLGEFRKIAETLQIPPGARLEVEQLMDPGGDFLFYGWWVQLELPKGDGETYAFPIRSRVLRSVSLEEALASARERLNPGQRIIVKGTPAGRKVMQERVESLKARIERRDKGGKP